MTPSPPQTEPVRLPGRTEQRGSRMGFSTRGGFLFGVPFVAAGIGIALVGLRIIHVNPNTVHAPHWVLSVVGVVFILGGLMIWGRAWRQHRAHRRKLEIRGGGEQSLALSDYEWDPHKFAVPRWSKFIKSLAVASFLTLFLSIFNFWAFAENGPWPVKGVVIFFDLITLAVWWQTAVILGRTMKFGGSQLVFTDFPYLMGRPLVIRWRPATGIDRAAKGKFTLRCVKEWYESRGHGRNRSPHLVHEQIWSVTWNLDHPRTFQPGNAVEISYDLPADLSPTQLSADTPVFWEFDVQLDLPGLDFEELYLVPIYQRI